MLCVRTVTVAYGDLQDYVNRCNDPLFLERLLQLADAEVTAEKKEIMAALHDGLVELSRYAADRLGGASAGRIVAGAGWLVEAQVGSRLDAAQLYALQQMLAVTVTVETFVLDAVNRALSLVKALSVLAVAASAAMIACVLAHVLMLGFWAAYHEAYMGTSASYAATALLLPVKRGVRLVLKLASSGVIALAACAWTVGSLVIPTVTRTSLLFTCAPYRGLGAAAAAALGAALAHHLLLVAELWVWRFGRIAWIKGHCTRDKL